ncbi:rhodanese-like domain-containing protein [Ancylomarina salipaludis]|uniref:Rhodanese-like domain-containing protein n=1 Tax=Ancylomarina salipaludis TaxID=2501299 RepID=A0A4Q1JM13_9BACT|nr:rhodanese-like domain-containing protein [Ancylomarina salipaludis]RXQ95568.1 rhodanese-like domain-containing protein [Ancylomarina salipaludis]
MNIRLKLAAVFLPLGLIIAAVPENTTKAYKLTAEELLVEAQEGAQFMSTDEIADMLVQKDPSFQLIDVRAQNEFEKFHLPNAINIPISEILSEDWADVLDQDVKMNVFYSNGTLKANEAWMITRQLGFNNNYVLQGGLNYWIETILNPTAPASTSPDEEIAKYDFRKGAGMALGGASVSTTSATTSSSPMPAVKKKKKKKRAAGGC